MKIGLVQYDPVWESKEDNKNHLQKILSSLNGKVDLLIFPEMTLTGFTMNSKEYAEDLNGGTINFFVKIACDYKCDVFTGLIERENNQFYNSLVHINEKGEVVNKYFKIHPYSPSGENKNYSAGNKPVITKINEWKIGLSICYDLRFPELYRFYGKENVDLIVDISNWPVPRN